MIYNNTQNGCLCLTNEVLKLNKTTDATTIELFAIKIIYSRNSLIAKANN